MSTGLNSSVAINACGYLVDLQNEMKLYSICSTQSAENVNSQAICISNEVTSFYGFVVNYERPLQQSVGFLWNRRERMALCFLIVTVVLGRSCLVFPEWKKGQQYPNYKWRHCRFYGPILDAPAKFLNNVFDLIH